MVSNEHGNSCARAGRAITKLSAAGYRVSRPLANRSSYCDEAPGHQLLKGLVLDTETTGVLPDSDRIIELGKGPWNLLHPYGACIDRRRVAQRITDSIRAHPVRRLQGHRRRTGSPGRLPGRLARDGPLSGTQVRADDVRVPVMPLESAGFAGFWCARRSASDGAERGRSVIETPLRQSCAACDCEVGRRPVRAAVPSPGCRCASADQPVHDRSDRPSRAA